MTPTADLRRAVAVLTVYLNGPDLPPGNDLSWAASLYADAAEAMNDRLAVCDELLARNQRSEALRQAQIEPDVAGTFAVLDAISRDELAAAAVKYGLRVPPQLAAVVVQRLRLESASDLSTDGLLREHRYLALARAPLRDRLALLRLLVRAEPLNLEWGEDLRAYEIARFDQLRLELLRAEQREDWLGVRSASHELASKEWKLPPPLDLQADATALVRKHGRAAAAADVECLVMPLRTAEVAYERALDTDADAEVAEIRAHVRQLFQRANAVRREYQVSFKDPLFEAILPIYDRLKRLDGVWREKAGRITFLARLQTALRNGTSIEEVRPLYAEAGRLGPIPPDVCDEYDGREREAWRQLVIRRTAMGVVAFLALLVLAVGTLVLR